MKRTLALLILAMFVFTVNAQSSIDKLFNKYQGQDGFVTVSISGSFLKILSEMDDSEDEFMRHANKFSTIRILAQEDDDMEVESFYNMVIDEVDKGGYEEMVTVNSSDADVKVLVKIKENIYREFLVIAGGDENAIIQIKGSMSLNDVKDMSKSINAGDGIHTLDIFN